MKIDWDKAKEAVMDQAKAGKLIAYSLVNFDNLSEMCSMGAIGMKLFNRPLWNTEELDSWYLSNFSIEPFYGKGIVGRIVNTNNNMLANGSSQYETANAVCKLIDEYVAENPDG